jgi:hypothetical protein
MVHIDLYLPPVAAIANRVCMFESCRAHGLFKPFSRARYAEQCTIRPSYFASASTGAAIEPCPEGAETEHQIRFHRPGPVGNCSVTAM